MAILTLYSADLDDPLLSDARVAGCLNAAERTRADRYARPDLARRFVAGRVIMRHVLARVLGVPPADVAITHNAWGRPELAGGPFFNLSHAGRSALFAIDELAPVGVDIEIDDPAAEQGWFDAILSARERAEFDAGRPAASTLLRLWVRKEAIVKAIGRGFSIAPAALDVGLREVDVHKWRPIEIDANGVSCSPVLIDLPGHEIAALARIGPASAHIVHKCYFWNGLVAQ
ncbi:4'-phosphopantetheinyl transferase family protein [Bradyrhizobium cajani]|uniref:4'-phosphopantetheinyl transferase superfamily protein n=1 Tax=Bradyrhizobium cajani TaxID=1928661 RepID=A0A844TJR1_9BRAD|nr:4'-phosphopantetheinyl transferase superfamily protein [Bradyrhizobium cajani]MCP3368574.1 4'-phosphopantetheinyl transferase superfamily protein [Bradyrhizobium cajani]MVT75612.1 4'-phosphopantetheinyl transferase superfamily protein [Bradyrhizobium cajani]